MHLISARGVSRDGIEVTAKHLPDDCSGTYD